MTGAVVAKIPRGSASAATTVGGGLTASPFAMDQSLIVETSCSNSEDVRLGGYSTSDALLGAMTNLGKETSMTKADFLETDRNRRVEQIFEELSRKAKVQIQLKVSKARSAREQNNLAICKTD